MLYLLLQCTDAACCVTISLPWYIQASFTAGNSWRDFRDCLRNWRHERAEKNHAVESQMKTEMHLHTDNVGNSSTNHRAWKNTSVRKKKKKNARPSGKQHVVTAAYHTCAPARSQCLHCRTSPLSIRRTNHFVPICETAQSQCLHRRFSNLRMDLLQVAPFKSST